MNPNGWIVGESNYPQWIANIYPFKDRPDVPIRVVFYAVPDDRPIIFQTPFRPRWFDAIDGWVRGNEVGVGTPDIGRPLRTNNREWQIWSRRITSPSFKDPTGTPEQWRNGVLFSDWIAGKYGPMVDCISLDRFDVGDSDTDDGWAGRNRGALSPIRDEDSDDGHVEWPEGVAGLVADEDSDAGLVEWETGISSIVSDSESDAGFVAWDGAAFGTLADEDSDAGHAEWSEGVVGTVADSDSDEGSAEWETGISGTAADEDSDAGLTGISLAESGTAADEDSDEGHTEASSGPPGPGPDCDHATLLSVGDSVSSTVAAHGNDWWKFNVTSGTRYKVSISSVSGDSFWGGVVYEGTCSSFSPVGPLSQFALCVSAVAGSTTTWLIQISGGFSSSTTYTVTIGTGTCP